MTHSTARDAAIILTNPPGLESPFALEEPDELVFCCFFKERDERGEFLERLKGIAAGAGAGLETGTREELAADYARHETGGDTVEAFFAAAQWWVGTQKRGYHVYSLKEGLGPYRTGCVISFTELEPEDLRWNLAFAAESIEQTRHRILDTFGFTGL